MSIAETLQYLGAPKNNFKHFTYDEANLSRIVTWMLQTGQKDRTTAP